jgi:hypothetical protein
LKGFFEPGQGDRLETLDFVCRSFEHSGTEQLELHPF